MTPSSVREAVHHGHQVIVQTQGGAAIGLDDDTYRKAGAEIVDTPEEVFARAMRLYVDRYRYRHPTGDDLFAVFAEVAGEDLGWFFDQTLRGDAEANWAVLAVRNRRQTAGKGLRWDGSDWVCAPDEDTDTDTLAGLICTAGEVAKWTGSAWSCAPDDDTLAGLSCASNEVAKWTASASNSTAVPESGRLLKKKNPVAQNAAKNTYTPFMPIIVYAVGMSNRPNAP